MQSAQLFLSDGDRALRPVAGRSPKAAALALALSCTLGLVAAGCSREPSPTAAAHATSSDAEKGSALPTAATAPTSDASNSLRICGDPGNMPLSNEKLEGFQNKIADVLGKALGKPVTYFWHTYYERGLARGTINADNCDVLMDMTSDFEQGLPTKPVYRSTYVLIGRKGLSLDPKSLDDPILKTLKIGVFQSSPGRQALHDHGVDGFVQYLFYDSASQPQDHPGKLVQDVAAGKLDAAESWGPVAGYYAKRDGLAMRPMNLMDNEVLEYSVALAVAKKNGALKDHLDKALDDNRDAIRAILVDYNVPLVECDDCVISGDLPSHGPYAKPSNTSFQPKSDPAALESMKERIAAGALPNDELESAIVGIDPGRIGYLLAHGANPDELGPQGDNALHFAVRSKERELTRQLIDGGAKLETPNKDGWTPLMVAVWADDTDIVGDLIARKANINAVSPDGWTPLTIAITYGDSVMVNKLVDARADVNRANESGFTPVMFAVNKKQADVLEKLIKRGANVNQANKAGITPLMMAAAGGQGPMAKRLIDAGANPAARTVDGATAADVAEKAGNGELVQALRASASAKK